MATAGTFLKSIFIAGVSYPVGAATIDDALVSQLDRQTFVPDVDPNPGIGDAVEVARENASATLAAAAAVAGLANTAAGAASPDFWVWDDGAGNVFCRWAWDATNDLLLKIEKSASLYPYNGLAGFSAFGVVAKSSEIGGTPTVTTSWESIQDDTAGFLTAANGRFGGGHSAQIVQVAKAAHGITAADIGKRFTDGTDEFAIVAIASAGVFTMVPKPKTIVSDTAGTLYQPASGSLTGMDGLGNLTGCTYTYTDALASVRNKAQKIIVDGREILTGEIVRCSKLEIAEYHEAVNIRNAFAYFTATGSTATWGSAGMGSMWARTIRYTIHPWAQIEIEDHVRLIANGIRFNNTSPLQFNPQLAGAGEYSHWWVPGAKAFASKTWNGSAVALDLNSPQYHASNGSIVFTSADTLVSGTPVDHLAELIAPQNTSIDGWTRGHIAGMSPVYQDGLPAQRIAHGDGSYFWEMAATAKNYLWDRRHYNLTAAGATFRYRAFRGWFKPASGNDLVAFVRSGGDWLIYCAWRTAGGAKTITIPSYVPVRSAAAVRAVGGSLVSATVTGSVQINQQADAGLLIIRLS